MKRALITAAGAALLVATVPAAIGQDTPMSFFVTSVGLGDGANLGGLEGADAHCQQLADAAGATGMTWRAYLSAEGVNARDRIGSGPWVNAKGTTIATDVENLHSDSNNLTKQTALDENGNMIKGRGDEPNQHDILTGSNADGTLAAGLTCNDWTSNGEGSAMLGHSDRMGPESLPTGTSWNAAHPSRGCSQEGLIGTGGNGYFYCFAAN
ncbi:MAG TPA: hypothetical protein GYA10_09780 [Alphaproteobacteria bacterium]|nr:hypothetical protein [Alphaproteobacteria bacterium]